MMITDYASLQAHIAAEIIRQDLGDQIPVFIQLCETDLQRRLDTAEGEVYTRLAFSDNEASLPLDYKRLLNIELGTGEKLNPVSRRTIDGLVYQAGTPTCYTIQGRTILVYPSPNSEGVVAIRYKASFVPLSATTETNWLLARHPDAYLYGSLFRAALFMHDPEKASYWKGEYINIINSINEDAIEELSTDYVEMNSAGVV